MANNIECIECAAPVPLDAVEIGEIIDCPDCSVELEITATAPLTVALAPQEAEDWGE